MISRFSHRYSLFLILWFVLFLVLVFQTSKHTNQIWSQPELIGLFANSILIILVGLYFVISLLVRFRILRIIALIIITFILGFVFCYYFFFKDNVLSNKNTFLQITQPSPTNSPIFSSSEIIELTNKERTKKGMNILSENDLLDKAAKDKLDYMVQKQFWAHNAPDGTEPWYFIRKSGYKYEYAGENLAKSFLTAGGVVDGWMNSSEHKANILGANFTEIGVAVSKVKIEGSETILVVQLFAKPATGNNTFQPSSTSNHNLNSIEVQQHLNNILSVKTSWEQSYNNYPKEEIDKLLDSFNRQIDFSKTLLSNLNSHTSPTIDDLALWNAIVKMSNESYEMTNQLNSLRNK